MGILRTLKAVVTLDPLSGLPDHPPNLLYDLWEGVEMFTKKGFEKKPKAPMVVDCGLDFIQAMVSITTPAGTGFPGGTWLIVTGEAGCGKSWFVLQMLEAFAATGLAECAWFDYEMGEFLGVRRMQDVGAEHVEHVWGPMLPRKEDFVRVVAEQADRLAAEGKMCIIAADTFQYLTDTNDFKRQAELAQELRDMRESRGNLLLITVNHVNKEGKVAGATEIGKYSDIRFHLVHKNGFDILTAPKNRCAGENTPDYVKLVRKNNKFEASSEPDFVSFNPLVTGFRGLMKKFGTKTEETK